MAETWQQQLDAIADGLSVELIALRRHLHAHPEPSNEEFDTSLLLYQKLNDLGLKVSMGPEGCGVVADNQVPLGDAGRIAVRGDIDALRIQDEKQTPYRSTRDGVMHACGHDVHATVAYGVAASLTELDKQGQTPWPLAWRAILQPAEETATGARRMIAANSLKGVMGIFALHVDPSRPTGQIGLRTGALTANCDALKFKIVGQGGHGARPHESKDPIAATAQLINSLYQFVPRANDSLDGTVVSIGRISGGENANVIPNQVELEGTLRTLDGGVRAKSLAQIRQIVRGVEEITDTQIELTIPTDIPSVVNHPDAVALLATAASDTLGPAGVAQVARPSMGSEDFASYLEQCPGAMFRLGVAKQGEQQTPLHTSLFDVDEAAIAIGVKVLSKAVVLACQPGSRFQTT